MNQRVVRCTCGKEYFTRSDLDKHVYKMNRPMPHLVQEVGKHERLKGTFVKEIPLVPDT